MSCGETAVTEVATAIGYGCGVTLDLITRNWSLVAAGVLAVPILLFLGFRVFTDSGRGQLGIKVRALAGRYRDADKAKKKVLKAKKRLKRLQRKTDSVKPRHLQEATEAFEDAQSLLKIADDQVLIAENHVRKIIVEEYPPRRQQALRDKYLRRPEDRSKPFTF